MEAFRGGVVSKEVRFDGCCGEGTLCEARDELDLLLHQGTGYERFEELCNNESG